jgi:Ni/Fe-hydrogenase subunit HybB-like protein
MHPLWWTPVLPLLFLLSAIAVGFPMVIFESLYASWSLRVEPELHVLRPLAKYIPVILGIYLAAKLIDLNIRGTGVYLLPSNWSMESTMFVVEMLFGGIVPFIILLSARRRSSPRWLLTASLLVVLGVILNRINVFLVAYTPVYPQKSYFPTIGEIAVTVGLIAALMLIYRIIVTYFPVISHSQEKPSL